MRRDCLGLTLVEILVVVGLLGITLVIGTVFLLDSQRHAKLARTRSEMRTLAVAMEAYCGDNSLYPPWGIGHPGPGHLRTFNWDVARRTGNAGGVADLPSFLLSDVSTPAGRVQTLTTPLSYIRAYPPDPYCPNRRATFLYWSLYLNTPGPDGKILLRLQPGGGFPPWSGWILVSPGPDGDYDLVGSYDVYDPTITQPSLRLLTGTNARGSAFTFDPTNGLFSDGDIWRVKQYP